MTQQDLAECIGLSRSAISRIEGKTSSDTDLLEVIAEAFDIPLISLISENDTLTHDDLRSINDTKSIRDIHTNSIEMYRKLPDRMKTLSRAMGLEVYNEILECENRAVSNFAKILQKNIVSIFYEDNNLSADKFIKFIDSYASEWISNNKI
ncbi:helix-turn-helix transcriptional regulator [Oceanirhabdus seepicola]|uniref:Helix-turn-helix transcriptional regulator n=2 Tax=Oceanirhabdus seepicola TaxID=2828781 RepID=A0A9J6P0N1_9CLOT|nr:helix-turn-helix transcriptional regulator [Oceanirhabdus seepicola]